jgi:hypothetical protein
MSEIAGGILFLAWAGLIILGMVPSLGARFGLWLRGDSLREPAPPPPSAEKEWAADPAVGKNLDRLV